MPFRKVKSKLLKARAMQRSRVLHPHLPETHGYHPHHLRRMLLRYPSVFVKPDNGSQGVGIIRVKRAGKGIVDIGWDLRSMRVRERSTADALRGRMHRGRSYIIQQGIPLARYKNRLIDIRVYMQKPDSKWHISGRIVRAGAKGRFLTNYSQGGRPVALEAVLNAIHHHNSAKVKTSLRKIDQVSYGAARALDQAFPGIRILGIDLALDKSGRIWIIEANTRPGFELFKHLRDRSMYQTIIRREHIIASRFTAPVKRASIPTRRRGRHSKVYSPIGRRMKLRR
ncbi:YheC/YheD family protein [Paenibacillus sp. J22TS3]|uniref:YheC/YheD family protein n=1 Tax=Paenibacillus sp. J22TS3 TaxID=2807192 RepID=UPI001B13E0BA|nr:YheC/YheD family protein [Paenibacillus sp. J22TS3]GIP23850.1 hypothetical protein J22TS3_41250 [Paenibacillus sp. J22TS3]